MAKIFSKNQGPAVDVKRNTFDLSHCSHLTGKIGDLIPVLCQEVIPGDSFQIDPKFGIRFNPLQFPIQTKMHGIMHFFYVRNRNLFDKWQEYIGKTDDDAVMPYLSLNSARAKKMISTGTLGDYLGVPTTLSGAYALQYLLNFDNVLNSTEFTTYSPHGTSPHYSHRTDFFGSPLEMVNRLSSKYIYVGKDTLSGKFEYPALSPLVLSWHYSTEHNQAYNNPSWQELYGYMSTNSLQRAIDIEQNTFTLYHSINLGSTSRKLSTGAYLIFTCGQSYDAPLSLSNHCATIPVTLDLDTSGYVVGSYSTDFSSIIENINSLIGSHSIYVGLAFDASVADVSYFMSNPTVLPTASSFKSVGDGLVFPVSGIHTLDATEQGTIGYNPFILHGTSFPKIKLNALPFRAYESIYNYFYRDEIIDPFLIDGKEVYNDYIPTHAGGADTHEYLLHKRNWERDYYTSCQSSPQQGVAPLVGISANGTFTFSDGTNEYTAETTIGDDGETIVGISTYSPDMPKGSLRQLMDVITNGISINDLRNVNSFQRWLETNIRRGYKYVDQIYSHFGVNPSFKANDMPEFLGGIHAVADISQVTNTSDNGLGQYAGQMSMFGGSDNKINKFCDEHGYIIGIMCVYPEPVYSQMLPKHFLKTESPLDYYFPEFGHIGMQPITYNEVTPLEVAASDYANNEDTINDVFGYQRAWADYLANHDQVHGDFRTSMSEFVASRVFNSKPELGHDFIAIDDNDINDIFVVTDGSDKMLGEIRFDIKAQRPIPEFGIPRIE